MKWLFLFLAFMLVTGIFGFPHKTTVFSQIMGTLFIFSLFALIIGSVVYAFRGRPPE